MVLKEHQANGLQVNPVKARLACFQSDLKYEMLNSVMECCFKRASV